MRGAGRYTTLFDTFRSTLAAGEDVKRSGFVSFTLHEKRARPGRNPKTGEPVEVAARRVVTFQASRRMKERCNEVRTHPLLPTGRGKTW